MAGPQHHQKGPREFAVRESVLELRLRLCVADVQDERLRKSPLGLPQVADRLDLLDRILELVEVVVGIDAHADKTAGRSDRPATHALPFFPHASPPASPVRSRRGHPDTAIQTELCGYASISYLDRIVWHVP